MDENVQPVPPTKARKRKRNPDSWKRAKEKVARYSAKALPEKPKCNHDSRQYKCSKLTMIDIKTFHDNFYSSKKKSDQDAILLKFCVTKKTKRRRPRVGIRKATEFHTRLNVPKALSTKKIPVCQKSFLGILQISVHRVRKISKTFATTGNIVKEKRGGDHTSAKNMHKLNAVQKFIESFKCLEGHYCRTRSERKYLPSDLNIKKMWRMYQEQCTSDSLKVKECYFRRTFNTKYNLSFGTPRTDVCSKCTELLERIKVTKDENEKSTLMIEKTLHKRRAKAFYSLLKEQKESMITISFDCQKNQVLPKVADQVAYYSRQIYQFNFGVVQSIPSRQLTKDNVTLYTWTEDEYKKGANEVASAVFDKLNNTSLDGIKTIRLVADGCGAQNKNSIMIGMCSTWLSQAPNHVRNIELVFPIPGHSYIPPDRVFGLIEKELKKKEVILTPDDYKVVFENHGSVKPLSNVLDWKKALQDIIKAPGQWHFQFAKAKRFFIKRSKTNQIGVKGETCYNVDTGAYRSILKTGKSFLNVTPEPIEKDKVVIKTEKMKDVTNLLTKHFGSDWNKRADMTFFVKLQTSTVAEDTRNTEEPDHNDLCENYEPDAGFLI